ncbi:glycerophosphodiester phosphodiesterase [Ramlibacter sp. AN1015]|uniref:glycerophosphodiester phosphodiesterase n=1 Tax=Ramlibacter sp. AN1015 TaxID=3133428 RepID=UPI0030C06963
MLHRRHALALIATPLAALPHARATPPPPSPSPGAAPPAFELLGHRGARGLLPENTLPGFAKALELGVSTLELDAAVTRDGVVVVSHDARLNPDITRGPDGAFLATRGPAIAELTAAELARYDVGRIRPGSAYAREFAHQQPVDGARIPRFEEVAALVRRQGPADVRLSVETKVHPQRPQDTVDAERFTRLVIADIQRSGLQARCSLQSFDWRTLQLARREAPQLERVCLSSRRPGFDTLRPGSPWTAGMALAEHPSVPHLVLAAGGHTWSSWHEDLDASTVAQAHALGLRVLAWTVNVVERMAMLMDMGVDGIVTDRPDLLRALMAQRGMPLPPRAA